MVGVCCRLVPPWPLLWMREPSCLPMLPMELSMACVHGVIVSNRNAPLLCNP